MKKTTCVLIAILSVGIAANSNAADRKGLDIETLVETVYLGDTDSFIELKDRAKSDDSAAQLALARLYNVGRNYKRIDMGSHYAEVPESSSALADINSSDKYEYWLKKSADGGNAEAAEELGCLYLREARRWEDRPRYQNRTEDAVKYLEMAAEKGRNSTELGDAYVRLARKTGNKDFFKKAFNVYEEQNAYGMMPALFISPDGNPSGIVYENLEDLEKLLEEFSKFSPKQPDQWFNDMLRKLEAAKERIEKAEKKSK